MQFKNIIFLANNTGTGVPIGLCVHLKCDTQRRCMGIVQRCREIFEGFFSSEHYEFANPENPDMNTDRYKSTLLVG